MKRISTLSLLLLATILSFSLTGFGQQVIGSFPTIDGGFEGQTTTTTQSSITANGGISNNWTISSTTPTAGVASLVLNTSGGRSGSKYITSSSTGTSAVRIQSPTVNTNAAIVGATAYTVQFFYRTPGATAVTNVRRNISNDGTASPGTYNAVALAATSGAWSAVQQLSQTSGNGSSVTRYGVGIIQMNGASAAAFDIDDYVIYAGAADNTAPNSPGAVTVNNPGNTSLDVSWGAASGGVDGGGYVVVRYAVSPDANGDPNQNGIYAVGNTTTNGTNAYTGTVRYIGTGTSFTDNVGLAANTTYYYKVYTVDKAFNYSAETQGNATTTAYANPTTTSISPSSANATGSGFTITVNGTNFVSGFSAVTWNGSPRTTAFVNSTQLTATIPSSDILTSGSANVGVTTTGAVSVSNTQTFTINPAGGIAQTITFNTFGTVTYGDAPISPGATASSGLTVTYFSDNTAVASVSGSTIVINGPGSANITASQGGNGTYAPAPDVIRGITVLAKPLTVSGAVAQNKLYDGSTAATITGYSIVETLVGADVVTVSGGGTFASASVGTGISVTAALSLGGAQAAKYSLTQPTGLTADIIAPILAWDFNTKAGNEASVTATTLDAGLNTSSTSRGAGITAAALPNGFSSSTYTVSGTFANAVATNQYFQFTVNAVPGKMVSLSSLDANFRRSSTGPNTFQWQYSLDGFATAGTNMGSPISYALSTSTGDAQTQIDLSGISALQNVATISTVTFRLYPYGASNTGGTFALGLPTTPVNDLAIGGTITNAPTPTIDISDAHPAAGTADQGLTDHPIGAIYLDNSVATAYLTGITVNTAGTYQASDITNIKFWINSVNSMTGATQLGATQASVASGGAVSISGLTTSIPPGSNRYVFVTASVASNAVVGRNIRLGSTSFANIQFASGNKTGTDPVPASNNQTFTQLDPTIAISNATPAASNINQNSTNQILHSIKFDITVTSATLNSITLTPSGSYQVADLVPNSFKFWINTSNNLTGATQLGLSQAIVSAGTTISVSGLSQTLNNNSTYYLLLTADVAFNAVAGRTVIIGSTDFTNIVFASSNKTGSDPVGGSNIRTITAVAPSITIAGTATTSTTIGAPSSNNIIYQFSVAPTVNSAQLSQVSFPMTGTYQTSDIVTSGMKLWYNSTNSFGTATQISSANAIASGSNLVISGLSQAITISTTGFFWLTTDVKFTAVSGRTIKVGTVTTSNFTFTQGTVSGTPPGSGTFTFIPQPILTEIFVPQYMEGNTSTNSTRLPYIYRVKISNLSASTTYRYYNSVVNASDGTTGTGAGTVIFPSAGGYTQTSTPGLSTAGTYGTFTTNASGEYTGWFINEPTGNARFTPGASVNMRIQLNDGASGTTVVNRVTTTSTTTVLNLVATAGAANGTGLRGTSSATAKNIVLLYDNVNGTGRPITAAAVESDGYGQSTNYPSFYPSFVDGVAGTWGTIIPNTLPNGIRRIEQRDLATGSLLNCPAASYNGTWPSGVNTANPTGGNTTILVISSSDAPLSTSASTWLGVTSDWNNAANWVCGVPNGPTADVVIPSNSPIMPTILSNTTIRNINLIGSATLNIGTKMLTINGTISGTGTFKGSALSELTLGGVAGTLNFASGFRELKTLILNAGATATLGTPLDITSANFGGTLSVANAAVLTTAGNLTMKSSVNGTASVGNSPGTITGSVIVERYIPQNSFRAWRMLSVPVQGAQTFKQSWQENQAPLANGVPNYGTLLTNTTGTNGYDAITSGNSLLSFTNGNPGSFTGVSNTNNAMATTSGYFVYIRGNRSTGVAGGVFNSTATTLRTTGSLYQGTQSSIALTANQNVMVGNVYASAIDFANLVKSGITSFKVWDPKLQGTSNTGGYQSFSASNGYDPTPGGGSYGSIANSRIESGQAFILNSTSGGSVQLTEAAKTTGSKNVFRTSTIYRQFKAAVIAYTTNGLSLADGNSTVFDSTFSNNLDNDDVTKSNNIGENFGILRNGTVLQIEARQPVVSADTVFFKIWNLKQQQYQLRFVANNIDKPGLTAVLQDNFLSTSTPINTVDTTYVDFTVTSNAASFATDRFRVVFKVSAILPVTFTNVKATEQNKKVNVEWKVASEQNISQYEVERSANGTTFEKIGTVKSKGNAAANAYMFTDQQPVVVNNYYRIKSVETSGKSIYSSVVKVAIDKGSSQFTVTPNPVINHQINLQFNNQARGEYEIRLVNSIGQILFTKIISHEGENTVKTIILPSIIIHGIYQLEVIKPGGLEKKVQKIILSNNN